MRFCLFRLGLAEISAKTQKPNFPHQIRLLIVLPDQREIWRRQCWRHQENIVTRFIAQFATREEILPKLDSIYKSSDYDKKMKRWHFGICAIPRSILRISICNFNVVFEPHVHTNGKPGVSFVLFFMKVMGVFVFFGYLCWPHLLDKKKRKEARLSICWFVHNQHRVEKSHQNTLHWAGHG